MTVAKPTFGSPASPAAGVVAAVGERIAGDTDAWVATADATDEASIAAATTPGTSTTRA